MSRSPLTFVGAEPNRDTEGAWRAFSSHREHIARLLSRGPRGRLTVLGAGNCNDLDLVDAVRDFGRVDLLDLDTEAVFRAVERQGLASDPRLRVVPPCDLSGFASAAATSFAELLERARAPVVAEGAQSTVVLSSCV